MKTPNIDKVTALLAKLTHFPDSVLTPNEQLWRRAIVEHHMQITEMTKAITKAEEILESIRGTVELGGSRITVQKPAYDQIVEALAALREVTPRDPCATGAGVGGSMA